MSLPLAARYPLKAKLLIQLQKESSHKLQVMAVDLLDFDSIEVMAEELKGHPIDVLINNAGVYYGNRRGFGQFDYADWEKSMKINAIAPMKVTEALLPNLKMGEKKILASITSQMGSIADNTSGGSYFYRSSKSALNSAMKSAALDLANLGITTLLLHPGWVHTDMGGPNALISVEQSVEGMRLVLEGAGPEKNGAFLNYRGEALPW